MTAWTVTRRPARSRAVRARGRRPVRSLAHQHDRDVVPDRIRLPARGADDPGLLEQEVALAGGADQDGFEFVVDHRRASADGLPGPVTRRASRGTTRSSGGAPPPHRPAAPT